MHLLFYHVPDFWYCIDALDIVLCVELVLRFECGFYFHMLMCM